MQTADLLIYAWCLFGIVVSVILPGLWVYVRQYFKPPPDPTSKAIADWSSMWVTIRPYVALGAASALTSVILMVMLKDSLTDYRAAFLAGYAWDSTLQKLR